MIYKAEVTREGRWWMIHVPEIDGLTQSRRLTDVAQMARELIAVILDVRLSEVDVEVHYGAVNGLLIHDQLEAINHAKAESARLDALAAARTRELVTTMTAAEVPIRDIGTMLGVSFQRVQQIANA